MERSVQFIDRSVRSILPVDGLLSYNTLHFVDWLVNLQQLVDQLVKLLHFLDQIKLHQFVDRFVSSDRLQFTLLVFSKSNYNKQGHVCLKCSPYKSSFIFLLLLLFLLLSSSLASSLSSSSSPPLPPANTIIIIELQTTQRCKYFIKYKN